MTALHTDVMYSEVPGYRPLTLDLYVGPSGADALCVFLHGGGWRRGTRRDGPGPTGPASQELFHRMAGRGLAVASIDYRLSGEALYPAPLDDLVAAIGFLADEGHRFGVADPPTTVWGVSAGAHLAALCALASPIGNGIEAVSCWSTPSDLLALPTDLEAIGEVPDRGAESLEALLLGAPTASAPDQARTASPIAHVRPTSTRFQLVHGTADINVPVAQSERFAAALAGAGADVSLVRVEGADHFFRTIEAVRFHDLVDDTIGWLLDGAGSRTGGR